MEPVLQKARGYSTALLGSKSGQKSTDNGGKNVGNWGGVMTRDGFLWFEDKAAAKRCTACGFSSFICCVFLWKAVQRPS